MIIKLNGTKIKTPRTNGGVEIQRFNLTKSGRVSSGKLKAQLIAKKRKLLLNYDIISAEDLQVIYNVVDSTTLFFTVEFTNETTGVQETFTAYAGDRGAPYFRNGYYTNVKIDLIEQ